MSTPLWTVSALAAAADGTWDGTASVPITGFSIDTRSLQVGEVFVALKDVRDGHDFVTTAFQAGAAAAMVGRGYVRRPGDGALLRVDDPLTALERIAVVARGRLAPEARVIAVTGSAGKTGTKDMLRACLAACGRTHAPVKSFNNHWGVPLTLARMPADTQFAVIEIGMNHADEIRPLTKMTRPHVAIVINVLPVHVGNFADGEIGVANAKAEIFEGLDGSGTAIMLRDSPHYDRLRSAAAHAGVLLTFGRHAEASLRLVALSVNDDGTTSVATDAVTYRLGIPGEHVAMNSLAVVAALRHLLPEGRVTTALAALADLSASPGRGQRSELALASGGTVLLIDESYNANPASMRAALAALGTVPRASHPRRIAVIGDMRELGERSAAYHLALEPDLIASGADLVFACGPFMQALFNRLPPAVQAAWGPASTTIAGALAAAIRPGDVVMVKGSLGTNMAPLVAAVKGLALSR